MNRNELEHATFTVVPGDGAPWGSNVPTNYTRYIYRIKVQNLNPLGPQTFTLGRRENGGGTVAMDVFFLPLVGDIFTDPDEIKEDSQPIYKIGGPISVAGGAIGGVSNLRATVDVGTAYLTVWYVDSKD